MLVINETTSIPHREFEFTFSRSPGPGGQNVNKLNTKVTLHWNVIESPSIDQPIKDRLQKEYAGRINKQGCIVITSHRYRDQGRNIEDSLNKLKAMILSVARAPRVRRATRPTAASKRRRLDEKRRKAEKKRSRSEYPED
jgi:ribosome-associated protein